MMTQTRQERSIFADPRKLSLDTAGAIASIDVDNMVGTGLQHRAIGRTTKVRFVDKLVAIDRAMRHLGLYERDNRQMESNLTIQVGLVAALPRKGIDNDEQ
jgi:hypothetical protein